MKLSDEERVTIVRMELEKSYAAAKFFIIRTL